MFFGLDLSAEHTRILFFFGQCKHWMKRLQREDFFVFFGLDLSSEHTGNFVIFFGSKQKLDDLAAKRRFIFDFFWTNQRCII